MRIDAHQHFWRLSNPFCSWPTEAEEPIYADFQPADLEPLLVSHGIDGTVLVQAAPSLAETQYLLELAGRSAFVKAVVGWIDFAAPSALADLEALASNRLFRGLRPMLQSIPDPAWMLEEGFYEIYERLAELGLVFDALILPAHLGCVSELAARHPRLSIVIDHAAKPSIRDGMMGFESWAGDMARLARHGNVSCKISGLLTEAMPGAALADLRPWLDHLYAVFGPERLLWGSDWPVLNLRSNYAGWISLCEAWLEGKPAQAREWIFGIAACRVYGLTSSERVHPAQASGGARHGTH